MTLVDTGEDTHDRRPAGARAALRRRTSDFCFTYGDGVADVDIGALVDFHRSQGTARDRDGGAAARPLRRARDRGTAVTGFAEKPHGDGGWINGGFFVLSPEVGRYLDGDATIWEREPLEALARDGAAGGLRARRVLAADGHAARHATAAGDLGVRSRAVGGSMGVVQPSLFWQDLAREHAVAQQGLSELKRRQVLRTSRESGNGAT